MISFSRSKDDKYIWLILFRHPESYKNRRDEHGGRGDHLTKEGKIQLKNAIKILKREITKNAIKIEKVYHWNVPQQAEAAVEISKFLLVPTATDRLIRPLNLGLLGGLSRAEAIKMYPNAAKRLELWRKGEIEITDLNLPKADSPKAFWNRGRRFITKVIDSEESTILVLSRSSMILFFNMLQGRSMYKKGQYLAWDFENCSMAFFCYSDKWHLRFIKGVRAPERLKAYKADS